MGFLDKAKAAAEEAAARVQEGVEDVQAKKDAYQGYSELGREAYRLIEAGEVSHPRLNEIADRIRAAEAKSGPGSATAPASETPPASDVPPAMPS